MSGHTDTHTQLLYLDH